MSASSFEFLAQNAAVQPGQQNIFVASNGAPLAYTAKTGYWSTATNWLSVSPASGTAPSNLTLSVEPANLATGVYFGYIEISAWPAQPVVLNITLRVGDPVAAGASLSTGHSSFLTTLAADATTTHRLTPFPESLTFNYQTGTAAPPPQSVVVSSGRAKTGFVAASSANWLMLATHRTTTPAQVVQGRGNSYLLVSTDPSGLSSGTYFASISLSAPGEVEQSLPVTLNVGEHPYLVAGQSALVFNVPTPGEMPLPQTVTIDSTGGTALNYTASGDSSSWLAVGPQFGSTSGSNKISIAVNPSNLPAGTHRGSISVSAPGVPHELTIPVTLATSKQVTIYGLSIPNDISLQGPLTGPAQTQTFQLTSSLTTESFFIATLPASATWLTVSPSTGTTPATVTVRADPSKLSAAGTYTGALDIAGQVDDERVVNIRYTVTGGGATGAITATPSQVSFSQTSGGAVPASQTVQLSSSTATGFTAASGASWLTVTPTSGTTPATLTLSANAAGLNAGSYQTNVTVSGGGTTVTIPVTLTVSSSATGGLTATPTSLQFSQTLGGTGPPSQTVNLSAGTATSFTASSGASWLTVTPTSGTTPATLTISVNASGLNAGTYQSAVTVTGGGTTVTIPVTLTVATSATGAITATPSQVSFSQALGGVVPASQTVQLSSSTATGFTASSGASWLTVTPISGTTPATLTLSVNAAGLNLGTYQTAVTITGGGTTTSVSVTITVTSAANGSLTVTPSAVAFSQILGAGGYVVQIIHLASPTLTSFTASSTANWLTVAPTTGSLPADLILSASAAGLAAGTYQGSITVNAGAALVSVPVMLTVTPPQNAITPTPASLSFAQAAGGPVPNSQTVHLDSPAQTNFTAVSTVNWLSVLPTTGTSPADLTFAVNAVGLAVGSYQTSVTVTGGAAPVTIPVALVVSSGSVPTITSTPSSVLFSQTLGGTTPPSQTVNLASGIPTNFTTSATASWLTVTPTSGTTPATLTLAANAAGLNAGTYQTSVTVNASGATVSIPVNLTVSSSATGGISNVSPSTLTFTASGGQAPAGQPVSVTSSGAQFAFTTTVRTADSGNWLTVTPTSGVTPATLTVTVVPAGLVAGQYVGAIAITPADPTIPAQTVGVALTITSSGTASGTPVVRTIVNAASLLPGPLAPGEIVTITGSGLGPATASGPNLLASGAVDSLVGQTRVLFDGTPAPLLFVSSNQINAIVPYSVFGRLGSNIQAEVAGVRSDPANLRITDTAPAIFTIDGSGRGLGAIVNQDGTINSPAFPAARGSVISIYATGEGQTRPPGQDGRIITTDLRTPMAPVTVRIGGVPVDVRYAGSAPGLVSGALQINVYVPPDMATGGQLPVEIQVGAGLSQFGVTIAVK